MQEEMKLVPFIKILASFIISLARLVSPEGSEATQ